MRKEISVGYEAKELGIVLLLYYHGLLKKKPVAVTTGFNSKLSYESSQEDSITFAAALTLSLEEWLSAAAAFPKAKLMRCSDRSSSVMTRFRASSKSFASLSII